MSNKNPVPLTRHFQYKVEVFLKSYLMVNWGKQNAILYTY